MCLGGASDLTTASDDPRFAFLKKTLTGIVLSVEVLKDHPYVICANNIRKLLNIFSIVVKRSTNCQTEEL
jgi:hypothetical protein